MVVTPRIGRTSQRPRTHPGAAVATELEDRGLTVTEAARRLGVSRRSVSELVNERRGISPEMALRLGRFFGDDARRWIDMQARFDLWEAETDPRARRVAERVVPYGEPGATDRTPDPVIEAYKRGVDRASIRENLRRSPEERIRNLQALQRFAAELQRAGRAVEDA